MSFADGGSTTSNILEFDGSDDYADAPGNSAPLSNLGNGSFSITLWCKPFATNPSGGYGVLLSKYGVMPNRLWTVRKEWGGDGKFAFEIRTDSGSDDNYVQLNALNTWTAGQWYFLAMIRDFGNTWKFYVDKVEQESVACSSTDISNTVDVRFGHNTTDYAHCEMTDVRIYDKAISTGEMATIYDGGSVTDHLIAHWDFHEGSGNTLGEIINNADATINGAVWDTDNTIFSWNGLLKGVHRTLSEAIDFADSITRAIHRTFNDAISSTGNVYKGVHRTLSEAMSFFNKTIYWLIKLYWRKRSVWEDDWTKREEDTDEWTKREEGTDTWTKREDA